MDEHWHGPPVIEKHYPFECSAVRAMLHLAENAGPFDGNETMAILRRSLIDLVHNTLPTHCYETGCGLRDLKDPQAYADTIQQTGEIKPRLIFDHGNPNSSVMFVGEGPGIGERNTYIPLVGAPEVQQSRCVECTNFETCFRNIL